MVLKNYLYNLMYQIISILLPVITIPYISRVLGADGIGKYSLSNAYVQYFVLFGMIGLSIYSSREVAYVRDNKENLSRVFWDLNFLRFITVGIAIILYYIVFVFFSNDQDKILNIIQGIVLIGAISDISWLFIGLENFKKVAIRNTTVKIIGTSLIFIFIKNSSQVWLYALILNLTQVIGQIVMWFDIPKEVKFVNPRLIEMKKHLKFSIKLFIPQMAINVYTMLDKVMLGILTNDSQVGMYDNSQKIIKILITIVTTLALVTMPKMASLYKNGNRQEFENTVYRSFSFVSFLSFPMSFGLIAVCKNFIPWFYGPGFKEIKLMFYFGSWLMITLAWSSIVGNQILISIKRQKEFTIAVTAGAIVNIVFNFVLIKRFQGVGTTISSVIAEFTGMFIMLYFVKDIISVKKLFKSIPKYIMSSILMFLITFNIGNFVKTNILGTCIQCVTGGVVYIIIMILVKDENLMYAFNLIRSKKNS